MSPLRLRDVTEADLPAMYEMHRDPESARNAAVAPRDWPAFQEHWSRVRADPSIQKQIIELDGEVVGYLVAFERHGHREVGYWIDRDHWGKGLATNALRAFLRIVTDRPLYAHVAKHNPASIRVVEKCGFLLVGDDPAFGEYQGAPVEGLVLRLG